MKFKTKEELIVTSCDDEMYVCGLGNGIDIAFKSFAERVEFYKKWKTEREINMSIDLERIKKFKYKLKKEERKVYDAFIKYCNDTWVECFWNDWLFDYCFGDI